MPTRCLVGMMVGKVCRTIYVHSDGSPQFTGRDLRSFKEKSHVKNLLSGGDRLYLTGGLFKDNGDKNVDPVDYHNFNEFFDAVENCWADYYYIFKDGVWYFGDAYESSEYYKSLTVLDDEKTT